MYRLRNTEGAAEARRASSPQLGSAASPDHSAG
jgi:hypothetical protein